MLTPITGQLRLTSGHSLSALGPIFPRAPAQGYGKVRAGSHPHLLMPSRGLHHTPDSPPSPHARAVCTPFTGGEMGSRLLKGATAPSWPAQTPRRLHPLCLHLLGPLSALFFPERERSGLNVSWTAPAVSVHTSLSQLPVSAPPAVSQVLSP